MSDSRLALFGGLPVVLALLLPSTASAQVSEADAMAKIEFARGLAADWAFVGLAETVIADLEQAGVSRSMKERLGLVKCDVYAVGARNERDPERRNELFEQALSAYSEFIDENPGSEERPGAETAFVLTSNTYAQYLAINLEDAVGEKAEELAARQIDVLNNALKLTNQLIDGLSSIPRDDRKNSEKKNLYDLMLNTGQMMAEIARTQEDGTFYFSEAIKAFENLVFTTGEGTPYALRAYVGIGKTYAYQQLWEDAAVYYEAVIEQTIPMSPNQDWKDMWADATDPQKGLYFLFLEIATGPLMEAMSNYGDMEAACSNGMHFYNVQRREGFNISISGYRSLLAVARAVLDSGGFIGGDLLQGEGQWFESREAMTEAVRNKRLQLNSNDFALRIAGQVNTENRGNILQVRAQKLVADVIERPGVEVSPDILMEAANGEYNEQNFLAALEGYRRVLRSLDSLDQVARIDYGSKIMNKMGNAYRRLDRNWEAAMAFREGAVSWEGDQEQDTKNAQSFYRVVGTLRTNATTDKDPIAELLTEAEGLVTKFGSKSVDVVAWNNAERAMARRDWAAAIPLYAKIPSDSRYYEKAVVAGGSAQLRLGKTADAFKVFDDYIEKYVADPKTERVSPTFRAGRKDAMATAEFFRGYIRFKQKNWSDVVKYATGFAEQYPEQSSFAPFSLENLMKAHLALGNRDEARTALELLLSLFPDTKYVGSSSVSFYKTLQAAQKTAEGETRAQLTREMAEHLQRANGRNASASFANLRNESLHWLELNEWTLAEKPLARMIKDYGNDPDHVAKLTAYVYKDYGRALLKQRKVAEAKVVLDPLMYTEGVQTSAETRWSWCLCVTGWVEGTVSNPEIIPGAGTDAEDFQKAITLLGQLYKSTKVEKYGCQWYVYKFQIAYTYHMWSKIDQRKVDSAKKQLSNLANTSNDEKFDLVDEVCASEDIAAELRDVYSNGVLRSRFLWLRARL